MIHPFIKISSFLLALLLAMSCATVRQSEHKGHSHPKREFRGAWIQTVFQDDYRNLTSAAFRELMNKRLDQLQACGINAIVFQVRPEADAFYASPYEPWSRFLTGQQGLPPDEEDFDPMEFLIKACHARNMEFHAWLNPYRAGAGGFRDLAETHIYHQYPEWFVEYGNQLLFDPGIPACRRYICRIVKDIVSRYEVDAIHMDDYFYPYPTGGKGFPDEDSFAEFGGRFTSSQRNDWRRENVNLLIQELKQTIVATKPWVRFGISPFGIYRNKSSDPAGSRTSGLQNYDDLYADVLLWMKEGWIDYCAPQIYWEIGHKSADYHTLLTWWNKQNTQTPLYIGQDVARTMQARQLAAKMKDMRKMSHVQGNIFWPANEILKNNGGVADSLKRFYHCYPALIPPYTQMHKHQPPKVDHLRTRVDEAGVWLHWDAWKEAKNPESHQYFVVYRFPKGKAHTIEDAESIYTITQRPACLIPYGKDRQTYFYRVTALDRFHNESKKSQKIKIGFEK